MARHHAAPVVHIGASNLIVSPASAFRYQANDYIQLLNDGEFDQEAGYEWSGLRFPHAQAAALRLSENGLIKVVHESWNEDGVGAALLKGIGATSIALAFPLLHRSYGRLDAIQAAAGRALPIIIHPAGQHLGDKPPKSPRQTEPTNAFAQRWHQPTVEWAANRGIRADTRNTTALARWILEAQAEAGLGMALDIHHLISERNDKQFSNPVELAGYLAMDPSFREVHLSIRPEFGGKRETLELACSGRLADTQTGGVLAAICEARAMVDPTMPIRVISEVAAGEIAKLGTIGLMDAHRTINGAIRSIAANAV